MYEAGAVVAYVDPTLADPEHFKLAMLRQDVSHNDGKFKADVFEAATKTGLEFKRTGTDAELFEGTVVMPIAKPAMASEKAKGKKKGAKDIVATISISRKEHNQVKKNVPRQLKFLEESESDADMSDGDDELEDASEDDEEEKAPAPSQPPKQILKIKGPKKQPAKKAASPSKTRSSARVAAGGPRQQPKED